MKKVALLIITFLMIFNLYSNERTSKGFITDLVITDFEIKGKKVSKNYKGINNAILNQRKVKVVFKLKNYSSNFNGIVSLRIRDKYSWKNEENIKNINANISSGEEKKFEIIFKSDLYINSFKKRELIIKYKRNNDMWITPMAENSTTGITVYKDKNDYKNKDKRYRDISAVSSGDMISSNRSVYYKQIDSYWSDDIYYDDGGSYIDIHMIGCNMTSFSMVLQSFGIGTNPRYLNNFLRRKVNRGLDLNNDNDIDDNEILEAFQGYTDIRNGTAGFVRTNIAKKYIGVNGADIQIQNIYPITSNLSDLATYLNNNKLVIIKDRSDGHWVFLYRENKPEDESDYDYADFQIRDPANGGNITLADGDHGYRDEAVNPDIVDNYAGFLEETSTNEDYLFIKWEPDNEHDDNYQDAILNNDFYNIQIRIEKNDGNWSGWEDYDDGPNDDGILRDSNDNIVNVADYFKVSLDDLWDNMVIKSAS